MHRRISIFRSKVDHNATINSDYVFTTGDQLKDILDTIKPYKDNCTIFLYDCENMVHFRGILRDNFPNAVIRHRGVILNTQ